MAGGQPAFENLEQMYAQLSPDQRSAFAQEFIQRLQREGNPMAQQFASMDPSQITPQHLAALHQEARQNHPGVLGRMMHHPIIAGALGAFAAYELDKHLTR